MNGKRLARFAALRQLSEAKRTPASHPRGNIYLFTPCRRNVYRGRACHVFKRMSVVLARFAPVTLLEPDVLEGGAIIRICFCQSTAPHGVTPWLWLAEAVGL